MQIGRPPSSHLTSSIAQLSDLKQLIGLSWPNTVLAKGLSWPINYLWVSRGPITKPGSLLVQGHRPTTWMMGLVREIRVILILNKIYYHNSI
ncbi:hypothetical protein LINGRAPRIM_LOCUS2540 [Linum grandiflorum]